MTLEYTLKMSWLFDQSHFHEYVLRFCAREYSFSERRKIILPEAFYLLWLPDLVLINAKGRDSALGCHMST